jgi:hypothetical protein
MPLLHDDCPYYADKPSSSSYQTTARKTTDELPEQWLSRDRQGRGCSCGRGGTRQRSAAALEWATARLLCSAGQAHGAAAGGETRPDKDVAPQARLPVLQRQRRRARRGVRRKDISEQGQASDFEKEGSASAAAVVQQRRRRRPVADRGGASSGLCRWVRGAVPQCGGGSAAAARYCGVANVNVGCGEG